MRYFVYRPRNSGERTGDRLKVIQTGLSDSGQWGLLHKSKSGPEIRRWHLFSGVLKRQRFLMNVLSDSSHGRRSRLGLLVAYSSNVSEGPKVNTDSRRDTSRPPYTEYCEGISLLYDLWGVPTPLTWTIRIRSLKFFDKLSSWLLCVV